MGPVHTTIKKLITWAQVHDLAFPHYKPDWNVLLTLTVDNPFCSNIRHSNEGQLKAVKLEHPLAVITWLYHGLIFLPIEVTYFFCFPAIFYLITGSIHPRKFCSHVTVPVRLTVRTTGIPIFNLTLSSYFGSLHVVTSWQLSKQCIRWPVSPDRIAHSGIDPLSSSTFLKLSLTSYYFSNDRRLKFNIF